MAIKTLKKTQLICCFILTFYSVKGQNNASTIDDLPLNHTHDSYTGLNADANIFNDISLNSFELLSTNIQFSKDNDLQKVIFAPFQLKNISANETYWDSFLRNTKLNLAQKNGISTFGLGFTWDNSMHNSKRGRSIGRQVIQANAIRSNKMINKEFVAVLKKDIESSKSSQGIYKLSDKMIAFLNKIVNLLETQPTVGFIPSKNKKDFDKNGLTLDDYLYFKELYKSYIEESKKKLDRELALEYFKALQENSVKITFGGNLSFFSVLGSDDVDLDNDNLNDNEYSLQQQNLSLGFTHIVNEVWGYSITSYYIEKRATAEAENELQPYVGLSTAIGFRTWILDKNYKTSKNYLESLFVSSIHTGLAFEYLKCNASDNSDCADGILKTIGLTPYVEFKINPKNQFRIGIPISSNNRVDSNSEEIGPFFQWRLQLTGKN
ncbi:hypothetical protein [uncultured Tenacibaculum sp.]|uniref:hypothetical protein n=1 Tax=uncultured Tenacibaculum sp. TaxID=174713 RepID=UPI002633E8B8|nr:hypothetical protein [uncultured Tenacibaculum sp.]